VRRLLAPVLLLAACLAVGVALLVTGGDNDPPPRAIATFRMNEPPLAEALAKAAEQTRLTGGDVGEILERACSTETIDLRLPELTRGDVTLTDVVVHKEGPAARAEATVSEKELAEYLPRGVDLRFDPKAGGEGIVFSGQTGVLGVKVPVTARVLARDGAVVVVAEGLPIGSTTLFEDARIHVDALAARRVRGGGLRVRVEGTCR
jgi:hypothetical protein